MVDTGSEGVEFMALSAATDIQIVSGVHPNSPARTGIFLHNSNQNRGVVANVDINSPLPQTIYASDLLASRQRWPQQHEIRVAPGATVLVGFDQAEIWHQIDQSLPDGQKVERSVIKQVFTVTGAYYLDPPFPQKNEKSLDFVWFVRVPVVNGDGLTALDLAISLHPNRQIQEEIYSRPEGYWSQFTVNPGAHLPCHAVWAPDSIEVGRSEFLGPAPYRMIGGGVFLS